MRGCCAILTKSLRRSMVGIILVDSSTSDVVPDPMTSPDNGLRFRQVSIHNGFENFESPLSFSSFQSLRPGSQCGFNNNNNTGRQATMLNQTLKYVSEQPTLFGQAGSGPLSLAYHPLKIVISNWMVYSRILARVLKHYEYSLNDTQSRIFREDIIDLQKWRQRVIQTQFKVRSTSEYISHHCAMEPEKAAADWGLVLKDLDGLSLSITQYGQSLERTI
ncbi:hypothetical protein B0T26DRAFT_20257 [Lasiosphaeria miniovina]|uniref:Uncharacterized protein n=1 Tax=Lasiosphaeria miniovina TaxID=1954250 RepID=A0AA40BFS2_9PEZI|nr:uncharacterized protein B0T26DRAFT_20257 [Lasiosphaeria miniovina]KAK0733438.1 hypothetical protein B0T26DRAFT_20257 [Lasiosphaeria miniovina]